MASCFDFEWLRDPAATIINEPSWWDVAIVSKKVTEAIRNKILSGEFQPGEHLRELSLAEMFNVSRTPIRVGLTANAQDGLLEYLPNKGFVVRSISPDDVRQAFEMRALLEGVASRWAAESGLPLEAELIAQTALDKVDSITRGSEELDAENLEEWRSQNQRFHAAILAQSSNKFLDRALDDVRRIPSVFPPVIGYYSIQELRSFNDQHRMILECILNRCGTRAEALMREHVFCAYASVSRSFGNKNFIR